MSDTNALWTLLESIKDPEIPELSITDLGMVRDLHWEGKSLKVVFAPTYCGCPANDTIKGDILATLKSAGFDDVNIVSQLSPSWSTDWISNAGRQKLQALGIAPPEIIASTVTQVGVTQRTVNCPYCDSSDTKTISFFGSTACKALHSCNNCLQPFEYFKCI